MSSIQTAVDQYDVIVIGSGIGGLTAASLLAKAGRSVLVLEQHDRAGGYAHGFKRKRYTFDSGVHLISGCGSKGFKGGQVIYKTLRAIEVYSQLEFVKINLIAAVEFPGLKLSLPSSIDGFISSIVNVFPEQERGLSDLLVICLQLTEEVAKADELLSIGDATEIQTKLSTLFRFKRLSLAEVWDEFIPDKQLQSVFSTQWPYLGLPPSKVSFVYWATMMIGYLEDGAYYCKGGFQNLADSFVDGLKKQGSDIQFNSTVKKIRVVDNQVLGVELESNQFISAPVVISNADMRQTVFQLVGDEFFSKRYIARLKKMQHSLSTFVVYLATDLDLSSLEVHHESFYYDDWDHELNYSDSVKSEITPRWLSITVPTLVDDSLAPVGQHVMQLTRLVSYDKQPNWKQQKQAYVDAMIAFADTKIPGLKSHLLFVDAGSPTTLERYTSNYKGSAYGWDVTPEQVGSTRAAIDSSIEGLYFTGHWSSPGGGVTGVSYSGMMAAQKVLGITRVDEFWQCINTK
ncbi:MAG: phytoene desaturase family protein [Methylococcaceae bacterium]